MPEYRLNRLRGGWAVSLWENGQRVGRYSLGTADRKEAERELEAFRRRWERPVHITVTYLWDAYRADKSEQRVAANMEFSGKALLPAFGHLLPEEVTAVECRKYVLARARQKRKPGTIWTELNHLQIVLNWAHKQRIISNAIAVERPPKPAPKDRRLTTSESKRLLDAATLPHIRVAVGLLLFTAARVGAILDLTWDRVDMTRGLIQYADPDDTGHRKGRATVPMNATLRAILTATKEAALTEYVVEWAGERVGSIKRAFAKVVADAGLEDVTPHVLRHTAASRMAAAGIPMTIIAAVLGHSDSRTTERIYAKFSPTFLRSAVDALDVSGVLSGSDEPTETGDEE